jgi:endonuclease YncB( thermonuclease family)
MQELLRTSDINTYPIFSLNGHISFAKLLSNYDGDTADILFIYDDKPMRMKARFLGYDTPEIKPSINDPNRDEKKKKANEAKERLWFLCTNNDSKKLIKIKCYDFDKYGRILIVAVNEDIDISTIDDKELFNISINKQMIIEGHGYEYYGGTKK